MKGLAALKLLVLRTFNRGRGPADFSYLGPDVILHGDIHTSGVIIIRGLVEGSVVGRRVAIVEGGHVSGDIVETGTKCL